MNEPTKMIYVIKNNYDGPVAIEYTKSDAIKLKKTLEDMTGLDHIIEKSELTDELKYYYSAT